MALKKKIPDRNHGRLGVILLVGITVLCLAPFAAKALNMDDPLFIWAAKHIQHHLTNPYGFKVNWYGFPQAMSDVTKNPPLACYYIALAASIVGWSEVALHLAFLIPTLAVVLGVYSLARRFSSHPVEAALMAILTPVFMLSANTIMCDMMMLAFWVWAVVLWVKGMDDGHQPSLALSAFLIALAALTKYYGIALIPLLLAYSILKTRKLGLWAAYLLIPTAILAGYQWWTHAQYGRGLLLDVVGFVGAIRTKHHAEPIGKSLAGLSFMGGGVATVILLSPFLWSRRALAIWGALAVATLLALASRQRLNGHPLGMHGSTSWLMVAQLAIFITAGLMLLVLSVGDYLKHRKAESALLVMWVIGTFIFAALVNWSVNGRSILPMVPAAGILLMRRLENRPKPLAGARGQVLAVMLVIAGVLSVLTLYGDYRYANTARWVAKDIMAEYQTSTNTVIFEGHWGFQYYMESLGGKAANYRAIPDIKPDDILVIPRWNTNIVQPSAGSVEMLDTMRIPSFPLSVMDFGAGAGFYADQMGSLPFSFGPGTGETYIICRFR